LHCVLLRNQSDAPLTFSLSLQVRYLPVEVRRWPVQNSEMTAKEIRTKYPNDVEAEKVAQLAEIKELLSVYLPAIALDVHALLANECTKRDVGTRYARLKKNAVPYVVRSKGEIK
jgi:hypothetical protein